MKFFIFFFFKQKTAYEMRISDWSSDVCSSDLNPAERLERQRGIAIVQVVCPFVAMQLCRAADSPKRAAQARWGTERAWARTSWSSRIMSLNCHCVAPCSTPMDILRLLFTTGETRSPRPAKGRSIDREPGGKRVVDN